MTPSLFHGPEARNAAVQLAEELGRPLSDPIGDDGLKVDDARKIIELAQHPGVGDRPPSLVIGPLDRASGEAADALLKTLEDLSEAPLRLVLWTDYLSGVIGTIRSRTWARWCPPVATTPNLLGAYKADAEKLAEAIGNGDVGRILSAVDGAGKEWPELLQALTAPLADRVDDPKVIRAWQSIRLVLDGKGSSLTAADALLPEAV